jgi:hypothetical protein
MEIAVYSSGSITWTEAHQMSAKQREQASKLIQEFLAIKSGQTPTEFL